MSDHDHNDSDILDGHTSDFIDSNSGVYDSVYNHIARVGEYIPDLDEKKLPENKELQYTITKALAFAQVLGELSTDYRIKPDFSFNLKYQEAFDYFNKIKEMKPKDFYATLTKSAGKAFTISRINDIETLREIKEAFAEAMQGGYDPKKLTDVIDEVMNRRGDNPLEPFHIETVLRTNIQSAYSYGRMKAQRESGNQYMQYFATLDGRETDLCHELDGKIFKSDDDFWSTYYPPNHFNCRSTVVSFDELSEDEQVIDDGKDFLEKSELKDIKPGEGFQYQPGTALNNFLEDKAKELDIENKKESDPVTTSKKEKEFVDNDNK